jgi:chromosome partitioning protein
MSIPFFSIGKNPKKNKIIVFANQKGGCGKTTNCVMFADLLVQKYHHRLVMLDADPQRSIVKKHEQDLERWPQLQPLYQVVPCTQLNSESDTQNLIRAMRNEDFDFVIDTPGSLTLQGLLPLVFEADAVIVPIQLEKTSINSTTSFIEMCVMVAKENGGNKLPDFYFLPNQFNKNWGRKAELTEQQDVPRLLRQAGHRPAEDTQQCRDPALQHALPYRKATRDHRQTIRHTPRLHL